MVNRVLLILAAAILAVSVLYAGSRPADANAKVASRSSGGPNPAVVTRRVTREQAKHALDYWTPKRMASATPAPLPPSALSAAQIFDQLLPPNSSNSSSPPVKGAAPVPPAVHTDNGLPKGAGPKAITTAARWTGPSTRPPARTTGKLFFNIDRTPNDPTDPVEKSECSASTVDSGAKNLVFTAAHCLLGTGDPTDNDWSHSVSFRDFVFRPDYPSESYGEWAAQAAFVPQEWVQSQGDARYDVGAVLLWPSEMTGGERVADVVGWNSIRFNEPAQQDAYAFGYPQNYDGGESLYYCHARSHWGYLNPIIWMVCDMSFGASGGPWLMNFNGETGDLFSVTSRGPVGQIWGPLFDEKIRAFYEEIVGSDFQSRGYMAYTHQDFGVNGEDYGIYVTGNDIFSESDVRRLPPTFDRLGTDINPSYAPPCGVVAYQSNRGATDASTSDYEIYTTSVIPHYGKYALYQITDNTVDDRDPSFWSDPSCNLGLGHPPKIAYEGYDGNDYEIYTISVDSNGKPTGVRSQITNNTVDDRAPSYSPDGEKIAYTSNDGNDYEIYQISATGGTPVQVTYNQRSEFDPTYSPDGKWIAFSGSTGGGDYEIYKVLLSKTPGIFHEPIQITYNNATNPRKPSYSPDGYHIVYQNYDGNDYELYTINLRYGYVRQLTSNNTNDCCPSWGK